ncbi:MAG: hypothetical protein GYA60_09735 [Candidatus Methanofastidiosa archaeon]|nr:hypothetical protein [Candidatus Methanofastidiosa archaeon]
MDKEVTIMIPLYQEKNEEYTIKGDLYNYSIRLVEITKCDKDLFDGSCINTIELNILQKNKYNNETIKTVVVPNIIKVREIPLTIEFEDIKFTSIFVITIYFDQGAANFKLGYTAKDVLREMTPIYSGEMIESPISLYFGEADKVYSMIVNRSEDKLIVNVRNNIDSETLYGVSDDILPFGNIRVKVLNKTNNGIKFTVYSISGINSLSKSEISIKKGESFNIGGSDFKVIDTSNLSTTIKFQDQEFILKKRSIKSINGYLFELSDSGADSANINVYHPLSINVTEYSPNVTLTVTKKLEAEEGDVIEIPFTLANTGKANAENLEVILQGSGLSIIDGSWKGALKSGETKDLIFKAKYNEPGSYIINIGVSSGQFSQNFQKDVNIKSKVTSVLREGPTQALIFIAKNYILTQERIKFIQNSINIFFYIGIAISGTIIVYSSMQTLPSRDIPKKKIPKQKVTINQTKKNISKNVRKRKIQERN